MSSLLSSYLTVEIQNGQQQSLHTCSTVAPLCCQGLDVLQGSRLRESQPQQPGQPMPSLSVSMLLIFITLGLYLWTTGSSKAKIMQLGIGPGFLNMVTSATTKMIRDPSIQSTRTTAWRNVSLYFSSRRGSSVKKKEVAI